MTREELEFQSHRLIASAKAALESGDNELRPLFMLHQDGQWRSYPLPPGAEHLMNSGDAKKQIFGFFRDLIRDAGADGFIMQTDTWSASPTEEGKKHLITGEWDHNIDSGFETLIRLGWAT